MEKNKLNLQIYGIHLLNPYKTVVSHLKVFEIELLFSSNRHAELFFFLFSFWKFSLLRVFLVVVNLMLADIKSLKVKLKALIPAKPQDTYKSFTCFGLSCCC